MKTRKKRAALFQSDASQAPTGIQGEAPEANVSSSYSPSDSGQYLYVWACKVLTSHLKFANRRESYDRKLQFCTGGKLRVQLLIKKVKQ